MPTNHAQVPVKRLAPGDDLEMINSPALWPLYPILPMKHQTRKDPQLFGSPVTGIILAGRPTTILLGTLGITDWTKAERIEFSSVEELLAEGWLID